MPRAGPQRVIRNPSNAYKETSASRSPEFRVLAKSLWRSSGEAAEFTLLLLLRNAKNGLAVNGLYSPI
jgi:hypothetical protein